MARVRSAAPGTSGPSKINMAHNICVHVVPHFGGVLITMSDGRNSKPSHRALSLISDRYRTTMTALSPDLAGVKRLQRSRSEHRALLSGDRDPTNHECPGADDL